MKYTKWLQATNMSETSLVGGKNASLGEMIQNLTLCGIKIPNGFTITTEGYDYFMTYNELNSKIEELVNSIDSTNEILFRQTLIRIRTAICNGKIPCDMEEEIINNYNELSNQYNDNNYKMNEELGLDGYVDVAVRSSATCEDTTNASFAGQQDTFLNVRGYSDLLDKIKGCFASLYNDRAVEYRNHFNYIGDIKLSVCVQKMIRSDLASAGVAFSIDTDSNCKDVVLINGAFGLGEMVVSGQIRPDEFLVFKPTLISNNIPIIDKKLGEKSYKMVYSNVKNERTSIIPIEASHKKEYCLSDTNVIKLAEWVVMIEKYYTKLYNKWCPMDIEWAVDGITDELYIIQARPETVCSLQEDNQLVEYKLKSKDKNIITTGIAIGDKIATGKVKIMFSLDSRDNDVEFEEGDILVTEITDPNWEPIMKKASAIITDRGGRTCHAAIVARELGIASIVGTSNCTQKLQNHQDITVSCAEGNIGYVYSNILDYEIIRTNIDELPKINTNIMMNVASPNEAFKFAKIPNKGIGLAREEFIINSYIKVHPLALLKYDTLEDEEVKEKIMEITSEFDSPEEYYIKKLSYGIGRIGAAFYPNDVIVRFSDFKSNEYSNLLGGKYFEPHEENPMIGWRGASRYYSEKFIEAFGLECKAINYVRTVMGLKNVIVMIPFCRTLTECDKVLDVMSQFGLTRGVDGLKVYLMCEIPSNVILAEKFCEKVDGFSIGSNDLTQLTLGLDRDSELVADIYDERDEAVKELLRQVIATCKRKGVKIGICGQGPSDLPDFAHFLVQQKIDSISLTPDSVIKTIKMISEFETMNTSVVNKLM
jgi:pyruvate, water dikinase